MSKLIKTELYKLRTSKLFIVLLTILAVLNIVINVASTAIMNAVAEGAGSTKVDLSGAISSPFSFGMLMMLTFISLVSFLYLDFSGGYIKNIAGQAPDRNSIVTAKIFITAVHNLIFFLVAALSNIVAGVIVGLNPDTENLGAAIATFCIKWLLSLAIGAILMFFAVGLKSKSFALILAVIFPLGALSLLYMGIDAAISYVFKVESFSLSDYMPDSLIGSVNVAQNNLVANGIIVAIVFIALFCTLTYITFKKKDIK